MIPASQGDQPDRVFTRAIRNSGTRPIRPRVMQFGRTRRSHADSAATDAMPVELSGVDTKPDRSAENDSFIVEESFTAAAEAATAERVYLADKRTTQRPIRCRNGQRRTVDNPS